MEYCPDRTNPKAIRFFFTGLGLLQELQQVIANWTSWQFPPWRLSIIKKICGKIVQLVLEPSWVNLTVALGRRIICPLFKQRILIARDFWGRWHKTGKSAGSGSYRDKRDDLTSQFTNKLTAHILHVGKKIFWASLALQVHSEHSIYL